MNSARFSWKAYYALAIVHAALCGYEAYWNSPTRNEAAHLAAGLSHLAFQRFDLYRVNPPLIRCIAALPVAMAGPRADWTAYRFTPTERWEARVGSRFAQVNGYRFFFLVTLARWACIPFSLLGALICGRWASRLYGTASGVLAMTLWCFSPMVLSHASLITPDAHAAALAVCMMYLVSNWRSVPTWENTLAAGLLLGLAELTKLTLMILYPAIVLLWMVSPRSRAPVQGKPNPKRLAREGPRFHQLVALLSLSVLIINLGYGFEGTLKRLGDYRFQSRLFTGLDRSEISSFPEGHKSRLARTILDSLPVPLPANYVQGIDTQRRDFEGGLSSYLRGQWADQGWWYYYLYALAIKIPLGTWCLVAVAIGVTIFGRYNSLSWRDEVVVLAPFLAILIFVSSQTGFSVHSRYMLPALPFLFVWISKVGRMFQTRPYTRRRLALGGIVLVALTWSVGSSLVVYPHSLSYFNELAACLPRPAGASYPKPIRRANESPTKYALTGGPYNGPRHLLDSNIDWGQDLFFLKQWLDGHPAVKLNGLAFWDTYPATLGGIPETPLPVPGRAQGQKNAKLPSKDVGPKPGWYALSVNYIFDRDRRYRYFLSFQPTAMAGYSIYIYHITLQEANMARKELGLPELTEGRRWPKLAE